VKVGEEKEERRNASRHPREGAERSEKRIKKPKGMARDAETKRRSRQRIAGE
jgi:hypothetical protein